MDEPWWTYDELRLSMSVLEIPGIKKALHLNQVCATLSRHRRENSCCHQMAYATGPTQHENCWPTCWNSDLLQIPGGKHMQQNWAHFIGHPVDYDYSCVFCIFSAHMHTHEHNHSPYKQPRTIDLHILSYFIKLSSIFVCSCLRMGTWYHMISMSIFIQICSTHDYTCNAFHYIETHHTVRHDTTWGKKIFLYIYIIYII